MFAGNTAQVVPGTGIAGAGAASAPVTRARGDRRRPFVSPASPSHRHARPLRLSPTWPTPRRTRPASCSIRPPVVGGLVALHVLVLLVIVARAASLGTGGRRRRPGAYRIATSPAIPYRNFPVEFMPAADAVRSGPRLGRRRGRSQADRGGRVPRRHGRGRRAGVGLGTASGGHLPAAGIAAAVVPLPAVRSRRGRARRVVSRAAAPAARGTRRRRTRSRRDGQALAVGAGADLLVPSRAARPARRRRGLSRDRGLVVPHRRPEGAVPGAVVPRHAWLARGERRRQSFLWVLGRGEPIGRPTRSASATPPWRSRRSCSPG